MERAGGPRLVSSRASMSLGTIVMKFGGTSVADAERLKGAARKIVAKREAGHRVIAVLSARAVVPWDRGDVTLLAFGRLDDTTLTLLQENRTVKLKPAVRFTKTIDGSADPNKLLGKVKTTEQLAAMEMMASRKTTL